MRPLSEEASPTEMARREEGESARPSVVKPLKVLIVAPSLAILGGQAVQATRLLKKLNQEPSLEVSLLPINPRLPGILSKLQQIKYVRTVVTSVLYVATLLTRVRHVDLIHVFSASYFSFLLAPAPALVVARLFRKKSLLNYRSGEAEDHLRRWRRTALPLIRLADEIIVPSGYLVDVFARFGFRARAISNFIEATSFRFRQRRPLRPAFLSTRSFEHLYNVACVLRAFKIIQDRFPEASLILAGGGSQRTSLEALAQELGLRQITFVGPVPPAQMPELFGAADIYLNSPDIDNMPGSIIEAFASGLPVVTTNAGGIPYIVKDGETGLMVDCNDHEAMAACAIRLLEDSSLASRIAEKAYQECRKYSWSVVRPEWLDLYNELASGNTIHPVQSAAERVPQIPGVELGNVAAAQEISSATPVRVLIVAPSLEILGGQAVQANHLREHLSREPFFDVSFLPHNPRLPGPLRALQLIKYVRTIVTSLVYCSSLLLRVPKYDVIHIFAASYFSFLLAPTPAVLIAKVFRKKTVLNYHSGEAEDHLSYWPRTAIPIIRLTDELIVPSRFLVDVFAKFGLKAHAVANVIDQKEFRFRQRRPLLPRFLSNRNLYPLYNVACVLKAFALIQQKFPGASLTIAGDGNQRPYLQSVAQRLRLRNLEFRGLVAPEKMSKLYDDADIFLNGSNVDNMPGSILESFASGMPVVSTDAGGIPRIITHEVTGLLVPRNDPEAMASAAIRLLESPELAERVARNAYQESAAFTWSAVRDTWLGLYARLAGTTLKTSRQVAAEHISEPLGRTTGEA